MYADLNRDDVRYNATSKSWLAWDGKRWDRMVGEVKARMFCQKVVMEWDRRRRNEPDKTDRKELTQHWKYVSSASGIRNMLYVAQTMPGMALTEADLDQHPWLLNLENGTLDLRRGVLGEHRPGDLITQLAPVRYDEGVNCPMWEGCLEDWHPDGDGDGTWNYLQRSAGYWLTGDTSARCFSIFWGTGKNGKNVFLDTLREMLGDYGTAASRTLLEAGGREEHATEVADLKSKRLVVVSEPKKGNQLKTGLVKSITGDRVMKARLMRQDFFEFRPTFKIVMMTQNMPKVDESSDAIWDRLHKIPWSVRIPKEKQDTHLTDKLRAEWSGILNWALEGCRQWQEAGKMLVPTRRIAMETEVYRHQQDPAKKFAESMLVLGPGLFLASSRLIGMIEHWNRFEQQEVLLKSEVEGWLRDRDCVNQKKKIGGNSIRGWFGAGARADDV
jgi:putative DNA primase/helicase